jgi:hypothetical protein
MSDPRPPARSLRLRAVEVLVRLQAGEPVRFLDARGERAWNASPHRIRGAVRIRPLLLTVDPSWDRAHLTVVY